MPLPEQSPAEPSAVAPPSAAPTKAAPPSNRVNAIVIGTAAGAALTAAGFAAGAHWKSKRGTAYKDPIAFAMHVATMMDEAGFGSASHGEYFDYLHSEIQELLHEIHANKPDEIASEGGDVAYNTIRTLMNVGVDTKKALLAASTKVLGRLEEVKQLARERGLTLPDLPKQERTALWEEVKQRRIAEGRDHEGPKSSSLVAKKAPPPDR